MLLATTTTRNAAPNCVEAAATFSCCCCPHPLSSPLDSSTGVHGLARNTQTRLCLVCDTFIAGLYVPTSDIDLVVEHSSHGNIIRALHALANGISRKGIAKSVQVRAVLVQALSCLMTTHPIVDRQPMLAGVVAFSIATHCPRHCYAFVRRTGTHRL